LDAKLGVADGISRGLISISEHFEAKPETLEAVNSLSRK